VIISEYNTKTGGKIALAMVKERKKFQMYVENNDLVWQRVAQLDDAEAVKLFCTCLGMRPPSWLGKTYEELITGNFPWLQEKEAPND
jgi:hypothetical protein